MADGWWDGGVDGGGTGMNGGFSAEALLLPLRISAMENGVKFLPLTFTSLSESIFVLLQKNIAKENWKDSVGWMTQLDGGWRNPLDFITERDEREGGAWGEEVGPFSTERDQLDEPCESPERETLWEWEREKRVLHVRTLMDCWSGVLPAAKCGHCRPLLPFYSRHLLLPPVSIKKTRRWWQVYISSADSRMYLVSILFPPPSCWQPFFSWKDNVCGLFGILFSLERSICSYSILFLFNSYSIMFDRQKMCGLVPTITYSKIQRLSKQFDIFTPFK